MSKTTETVAYLCPECESPYPDVDEALQCCADFPEEVPAWYCDDCDELYIDLKAAKECCK